MEMVNSIVVKKSIISVVALFVLTLSSVSFVFAQDGTGERSHQEFRARVISIVDEVYDNDPLIPPLERFTQEVEILFLSAPKKGETMILTYVPGSVANSEHNLAVGNIVLVVENTLGDDEPYYFIADRYRINSVIGLVVVFFVLVALFAGWKGIRSMFGLAFSVAVIIWYIMPRIVAGNSPFVTFLVGGLLIAVVSIYLGHGFQRRTTIAVVSTIVTLLISIGVSIAAIHFTALFGFGTEEAFYIQTGALAGINLRGLLLGGIIIGILGVLDDITTAQAATVEEICRANQTLSFFELVRRGLSVGHEHIVSLVNTLALAYVGASLPLLLLFTQAETSLLLALNSEQIVEEIVRTLVGSSALIIAVPITTYLAAYIFSKHGVGERASEEDSHRH